jgi:hypothetical protein
MIIMDLKLDNLRAFRSFHMNMSYPKKVLHSNIPDEYLSEHPNFRYRKLNIIMGANATGKTSLGREITNIFAFIVRKDYLSLTNDIADKNRQAVFTIEFIPDDQFKLYRLTTIFDPSASGQYSNEMIHVHVRKTNIDAGDSYEMCVKRLDALVDNEKLWNVALEEIPSFSWYRTPVSSNSFVHIRKNADENYMRIFLTTLKAIDPSIEEVSRIEGTADSYMIRAKNLEVIIQNGRILNQDLLSSGTRSGIDIADMMSWLLNNVSRFFYCDEKFAYVCSDIEKAFLAVMMANLPENGQLFFTTHNLDILDMPYPKHSFSFFKKDVNNEAEPISCIYASDYLKRNTDSVRNAVENDVFSAAPSVDLVYKLSDFKEKGAR